MLQTRADFDPDFDELASAFLPPDFMRDAACVETGDVGFFPNHGETAAAARAVCARCLVRDECLDYALQQNIMEGVWGATTPKERRGLRRERGLSGVFAGPRNVRSDSPGIAVVSGGD